jgi:hypothetical protein
MAALLQLTSRAFTAAVRVPGRRPVTIDAGGPRPPRTPPRGQAPEPETGRPRRPVWLLMAAAILLGAGLALGSGILIAAGLIAAAFAAAR